MKAIKTTYLGPTNTKPSRIKASAEGVKSKTYPTKLASGGLPNGDWVHCFIQDSPFLRGTDLVVAQARTFVTESYPTQPGLANGTKACSAYHFTLLQNALDQLEG